LLFPSFIFSLQKNRVIAGMPGKQIKGYQIFQSLKPGFFV
jgi:hypothetical protein